MRQCLNPDCLRPNPDDSQFCQQCGSKLLLVERYWAKSILGEGGFGRTFLAVDELKPSKPPCVIKQFLPQAQGTASVQKASELFAQEAQQLEELGNHPQIPALFAYFTNENRQYLVQEFIDGQTLEQELNSNGVYTENQIIELLQDLLSVLQFVHENQVIHRDISPDNIIRRKTDCKLVLVDFGAAKYIEPVHRSVTGTIIGKAAYCAPEQSYGKPKFISDLYSLGVTCLHLLTGESPFDLYDVMDAEWSWRNYLNGNPVSDKLGQILDKLIEFQPRQRYQSVAEVLEDLSSTNLHQYQYLESLLATEKWQEADLETAMIMLTLAERKTQGWLDIESIRNFPCQDLRAIDKLWVKYSKGQFGFSVQKQIYQSLGGTSNYNPETWKKFGEAVGWRTEGNWLFPGNWLDYDRMNFHIFAQKGHLPRAGVPKLEGWGTIACSLVSKLEECNI